MEYTYLSRPEVRKLSRHKSRVISGQTSGRHEYFYQTETVNNYDYTYTSTEFVFVKSWVPKIFKGSRSSGDTYFYSAKLGHNYDYTCRYTGESVFVERFVPSKQQRAWALSLTRSGGRLAAIFISQYDFSFYLCYHMIGVHIISTFQHLLLILNSPISGFLTTNIPITQNSTS